MPDLHWPSPARDTTQAPEIGLEANSELRDHLRIIAEKAGSAWDDHSGFTYPQRFRTIRVMYERLGLIYNDENTLRLSPLGLTLASLPEQLEQEKQQIEDRFQTYATSMLARYQLNNPVTRAHRGLPETSDIMPFVAIWKAMVELDCKLHYQEMNRVLLRVMHMSELDEAISKIRRARETLGSYNEQTEETLREHLGDPVHADAKQASARIAPWFSNAGWGGLIIEQRTRNDGYRHLVPSAISKLQAVIAHPPKFFLTHNKTEWIEYYLGSTKVTNRFRSDVQLVGLQYPSDLIVRFLASCQAKPFVILTGLAGSGKTKLVQAFAEWISPLDSSFLSYAVVPVGADWIGRDNVLGYADALDSDIYVSTPIVDLILRARSDPQHPYFLILDEMNLSHVERYFADLLSAIESGAEVVLYSGDQSHPERWRKSHKGDPIPPALEYLPRNLIIVGTVNVDETTYMFSPKVLDRANVIEFRTLKDEIQAYMQNPRQIDVKELRGRGQYFSSQFLEESLYDVSLDTVDRHMLQEELLLLFDVLSDVRAEYGFRIVKDVTRFIHFHRTLTTSSWDFDQAMDAQVSQKILPKLAGSRRKLEPVLCALAVLCHRPRTWQVDGSLANNKELLDEARRAMKLKDRRLHPVLDKENFIGNLKPTYPSSLKKIERMLEQAIDQGFTSFTEA